MTKALTTLLFDLDGTLINTNHLIIRSFQETFKHFTPEKEYTQEDILPFMGPSLIDTFSKIDPERAEEMVEFYRVFNLENHDEMVVEFDGVYETIRSLYESDYKLAIVSTKMYETVMRGLRLTGLDKFFQVVIGLDQVSQPKPDPEGINMALSLLNSTKEEAIMIGDNSHDILAGKNAGTKTAGVAWSLKGVAFMQQLEPDFLLEKMSDILPIMADEDE